jgi:cobalt-zinc-cadmium efflux system protein
LINPDTGKMGHHHDHTHSHTHDHGLADTGNIKVAFFLNLVFTLIELVGGILTNSVAILSDALHDLGDSLSLGLAWYFQKLSKKGRNRAFSYGYKRFSLFGAIINSIVLVIGSVIILMETIPRLANPEAPDAKGMIFLAILGVVVNGAAVLRLKKGDSLNERVVSLHLLEDVLGWVAVLIGAIVMFFFDLPIIDPILSILIAAYVLFNVYRNLKTTFFIVMQGVPSETDLQTIRDYLLSVEGVNDIHDLHVWSMDGNYNVLTVHLTISEDKLIEELSELKKVIRHSLLDLGIAHATLEFEIESEKCVLIDC